MVRALCLGVCLQICLGFAAPALAQDRETLADIRQDLTVLNVEIQRLRTELSTTSGATVPSGSNMLDRVTLIEQELQRLTARTEELEFRISRIVADATNRIGDLEFRLVELEGGDVSQLSETSTLGGDTSQGGAPSGPATLPAPVPPTTGEVAVGERADFEEAQALLESGDPAAAAAAFQRLIDTYPGSPFTLAALLARGDALDAMGQPRDAGRAFLNAYNADPQGPTAPLALLKLGQQLSALGETEAACRILGQLALEFPDSAAGQQSGPFAASLGCA